MAAPADAAGVPSSMPFGTTQFPTKPIRGLTYGCGRPVSVSELCSLNIRGCRGVRSEITFALSVTLPGLKPVVVCFSST
jgi:hypothetical protein